MTLTGPGPCSRGEPRKTCHRVPTHAAGFPTERLVSNELSQGPGTRPSGTACRRGPGCRLPWPRRDRRQAPHEPNPIVNRTRTRGVPTRTSKTGRSSCRPSGRGLGVFVPLGDSCLISSQARREQSLGVRPRDCPREIEALSVFAPKGLELMSLVVRFHALGDHVHGKVVSQFDDGLDDLPVLGVGLNPLDEGTVDLERVEGELTQVAQGRVAGAEVIDSDLDSHGTEAVEHLDGKIRVAHDRTLGDLQLEAVRVHTGPAQASFDLCDEAGLDELFAGEIDADDQGLSVREAVFPVASGDRLRRDTSDGHDQPVLFGDREELVGEENAPLGRLP